MSYFVRIGLLVVLGVWPKVVINQSLQVTPRADTGASAAIWDDPEQLFVGAVNLYETGDRAGVSKRIEEACSLWSKRGEPERAARARLQIADLYRRDKRFDESLSQYRQTLLIEGLSASLKAVTYDSIGQIYAELYQVELSLRNYATALTFARLNKDYAVEAQIQADRADLSFKKGDFQSAMALAQSAAISNAKGHDEKAIASSLGLLGRMEAGNGLLEKGRADLERALALYQQENNLPDQIKTLCFLSGLNLSARQVSLAQQQAESALRVAKDMARSSSTNSQRLRANALRWPCWLALARAQRASQKREEALRSYFQAVSGTVLDWVTSYAVTDRSAIGFAEERQAAYRELVDLLVELGRTDDAYNEYQNARVRSLSSFIRARRTVGLPSDSEKGDKTREHSASITALRTRLLSPTLNREQRDNLQRELVEFEGELAEERVQAELKASGNRLVFSKPARLKQLQHQVLGEAESVLEFYLGEDRSFAWLISSGRVGFEILPGRKEIEAKVRQYLDALAVAPMNLHLQFQVTKQQAMAEELCNTLLGKLANQLRPDSKLIVIPDGLLNYVPYESLVHNGRYLIEDYQISYLPSASLLELLRQPSPRSAAERGDRLDLLAFGDPVFGQQAKTRGTGKKLPLSPLETKREGGDSDISNLPRLPRTRDEVEYIAGLIPKERERLHFGKDSTEKVFKQERLSKYRWIHLATHSSIDERNPDRSAVVLALDDSGDEDGFLRATEIVDLDLDCDLVVLSACETGRGRLSSGEGIIGLSRAFLIAGARSLVVSQWAVSDISTAQLMKDFYQQLVNNATTPAALREAKLRMLHGGSETRHPHYWAPFVLIGAP